MIPTRFPSARVHHALLRNPVRRLATSAPRTHGAYRVLVLGGYGTFGGYVCQALSGDPNIALTVAGRDLAKAQAFAHKIATPARETAASPAREGAAAAPREVASLAVDVNNTAQLRAVLRDNRPDLVVHTCGPFQGQGYHVAKECIDAGVNYVDLADGREFVCEIDKLDEEAKKKNVVVISGASSVPGLSGAVVEKYKEFFETLNSVEHYISPGNQTERGVATVQSVLAYCGKKYKIMVDNEWRKIIGWQDTHEIALRGVGSRLVSACDIPDLELFPKYFGVPTVKFFAGLELRFLHLATVAMSHIVHLGVISRIDKYAGFLRKVSLLFFNFGTKSGGMSVRLRGVPKKEIAEFRIGKPGDELFVEWQIGVHNGDGPQIPSIAAIVVARKLAARATNSQIGQEPLYPSGARACMGFFTLEELKEEMKRLQAYFYMEKRIGSDFAVKENLYQKAIGDSYFANLPPSLQNFHSAPAGGYAQGTCVVTRGGFLADVIATILQLPAKSSLVTPTSVILKVEIENSKTNAPNKEIWQRTFDGKPFVSRQLWSEKDGLLVEEYGKFMKLGLRVLPIPCGFAHEHVFTKIFGITIPRFLSPGAHATTIGMPHGWKFDVRVTAPLVGLLVRYQGEITTIKH